MSERAHIGLDNPVFSGRLRRPFVTPAPRVATTDPEQSFLTDYVARRPGLNLITCNGQVAPGTDFNQRLIVFAQQL